MHLLTNTIEKNKHQLLSLLLLTCAMAFSLPALGADTDAEISGEVNTVFAADITPALMPYHATYQARFGSISGRANIELKLDPETRTYTYYSVTKPKGIAKLMGKIREWTIFQTSDVQVIPQEYVHKSRDQQHIRYNWKTKLAESNADGNVKNLELSGNEYDLLSLQMQLMLDAKHAQLKSSYSVIKDNEVKAYQVTGLGEEKIELMQQTLNAIKLKQQRAGSSRHMLMWLAPELDYAVVKMQQYKGETLRATLDMTAYKAKPLVVKTLESGGSEQSKKSVREKLNY
ncbi:MAG: DUF3108 domain-containing protein [Gammaproteobacteria bacterium]|nr:DUF3108 domain-containing protein [Gammaproteobacteria bacterium]